MFFGVGNMVLAACKGGESGQQKAICELDNTNSVSGVNLPGGSTPETWLTSRVGSIIGNVLAFVGVIFLGLIIYAGYEWMTAGGDSAKTTKAIGIMTDAVVGLIVIGAAYLLTQYVGSVVLGDFTT